jgi:hypothetical protein
MSNAHELGYAFNHAITSRQNYIESKNKHSQSAAGLYYAIIGNVDFYNRTYDRYHLTVPELNNAYYQNVPRRHDAVADGAGSISNTLTQGDSVLIAFEGGRFDNPVIIGSQFYSGNPSTFKEASVKGTLDKIPNVILPPTSQGEAAKAMAASGGSVRVQTKDTVEPNKNNIRATLKGNVVVGLDVFNKSDGTKTTVTTAKEVTVNNGSTYETVTGNQYSITEGLLSKGKQEAAGLLTSLNQQLQTYTAVTSSISPLDITYVSSPVVVTGQVLLNSNGQTYNYEGSTNNSSFSSTLDGLGNVKTTSIQQTATIDYDAVNKRLTVVNDILKTSREQSKYEQEVLLPCVENIKNVWNTANYLLDNNFSFSKPKFSLSYLCNLGSFKLKASFPPVGSIEQQIDYCAPSWLSVPLLVIKGLYDLGCSNAWNTDFLSNFASSINTQMSLMVCCDDNGLPVIGFNAASSIDISSAFAISGAPIPLRDPGALPNSVTIRPNPNTTINLAAPNVITDRYAKPSVINQKGITGDLIDAIGYIPSNTSLIDLEGPTVSRPTLESGSSEPDENNLEVTEVYGNNQDLPVGLIQYEVPMTLHLDLPLPTYTSVPYKVNRDVLLNTPYATLESTLINYGIPNAELLLSELKYLVKTNSVHNFFQVMSLVSQRPLVALVFNLINVYIQADLNLNQYIYKLKINKELSAEVITLFNYAESGNLNALTLFLNSYYGVEVDFLSWIYDPVSMLDWIVIQEPFIQPLFVSLQQAAVEDFCVLLVRLFNGVDLKAYESTYKIYTNLCQQSLNLSIQGAKFYSDDTVKVYIPEIQLL